jgi:hypothetical protein
VQHSVMMFNASGCNAWRHGLNQCGAMQWDVTLYKEG